MWDIICQPDVYRLTYKTVSWPTGWNGNVALLDRYDGTKWSIYCNTSKFIWSGEIKQVKARFIWNNVGFYMSTRHIQREI